MNYKELNIDDNYYPEKSGNLIYSDEIKYEIQECLNLLDNNSKNFFKIVTRKIKKYPKIFFFQKLLMEYYFLQGNNKEGLRIAQNILEKDPQDIIVYNRINECLLDMKDIRKYEEFSGLEQDISKIFPEKKGFTTDEVIGFIDNQVSYLLQIDELQKAELLFEQAKELTDNTVLLDPIFHKILNFTLDYDDDDDDDDDEFDDEEYSEHLIPNFKHKVVSSLYEVDFSNVDDLLAELKSLPEEELLQDLEILIEDFENNFESLLNDEDGDKSYALIAACFVLADLKIGFPLIMRVLLMDDDALYECFGDYLLEVFWMVVYDCEHNDLDSLLDFAKKVRKDPFVVYPVIVACVRIANLQPERREDVLKWFDALLDYLVDNNDLIEYDVEYYRIVCDGAGKLDWDKYLNQIKFLFDKELYPSEEYDSFEELKKDILKNDDFEKPILSTQKKFTFFIDRKNNFKNLDLPIADEELYENNFSKDFEVKRNDPCPCGSGKKYKKCCME